MKKTVTKYIAACPICQQSKYQAYPKGSFDHYRFRWENGNK